MLRSMLLTGQCSTSASLQTCYGLWGKVSTEMERKHLSNLSGSLTFDVAMISKHVTSRLTLDHDALENK